MYKGLIKPVLAVTAGCMIALTSCGSGDTQKAESLLNAAQKNFDNGNYTECLTLLDSVKKTFPSEIEIQRQSMHLRTLADEKITEEKIKENDIAFAQAQEEVDKLKNNFVFVKEKDMVEGYIVHKKAKANPLINRTGIEARIEEKLNLYIVSLLNGPKVEHTHLTINLGNTYCSTDTVGYNGSSNYRFTAGGILNETVTFRGKNSEEFCQFITDNKSSNLKLNFKGKRKHTITLSASDKQIISETGVYAKALQKRRDTENMNKYLEARLQVTRKQIARTAPEK